MRATLEALSKGTVKPVYVLGGNEWLLVSRCMNAVRTAVVGGGPRGFAEDVFDGDNVSVSNLLGACRTLPMMAKRRLVTVRSAEDLAQKLSDKEQKELFAYLASPEPTTVLMLVATKFDARRTWVNEAKKHGWLVTCSVPTDERDVDPWLTQWLNAELRARKITTESGVVERLVAWIGPELGMLSDALERLSLYTAGAPITLAAVDALVTPVREIESFDLSDAILMRDLPTALANIAQLRTQRGEALMILGSLGYSLRQLARAKQLLSVNPETNLSKAVYMHGKPPGWLANAVRRWTVPQLHRALRVLAATDAALKGSKGSAMGARPVGEFRVLEEFAMTLCAGAPGMGELAG
ncbi:MAG: holA [Myxococcaceae bacterium]|nr:holA [Myxococcaceae bacterium]